MMPTVLAHQGQMSIDTTAGAGAVAVVCLTCANIRLFSPTYLGMVEFARR